MKMKTEETIHYIVEVKYAGVDGYGYGTKCYATKQYEFGTLEEAQLFEPPKKIGQIAGHGVTSVLSPTSKAIYKMAVIVERVD